MDIADELRALSERVRRNIPVRSDPERFQSRRRASARTSTTWPEVRRARLHSRPGAVGKVSAAQPRGFRLDMTESVLEKLGTTESTTLSIARETGGKIRLT
jgi:hypothetical protein